jgi:hypothetical protein
MGQRSYRCNILDPGNRRRWMVSLKSRASLGQKKETFFGTECIGGWVGPRDGVNAAEKRKPLLTARIRTRVVEPIARQYTNWDMPTLPERPGRIIIYYRYLLTTYNPVITKWILWKWVLVWKAMGWLGVRSKDAVSVMRFIQKTARNSPNDGFNTSSCLYVKLKENQFHSVIWQSWRYIPNMETMLQAY